MFLDYVCFEEKLGPTIFPTRVEHADQYTTNVVAKCVNIVHLFNIYIIMWFCPGNMPKYYPGLRHITRPEGMLPGQGHINIIIILSV